MAFYDDPSFVMSHIRNSYVTSDDTGMSEIIILNEDYSFLKQKNTPAPLPAWIGESSGSSAESHAAESFHSNDIVSDMDIGAHRTRSNTAQRLDKLKRDRQSQANVKRVQWKKNTEEPTAEDVAQTFKRKEIGQVSKMKSLLSEQLDKVPALYNPFNDYAKYDGQGCVGDPTKKIRIFLTMLPKEQRAYPMPVVVVASAKVEQLVGLICWQYTNQRRSPKLRDSIENYSLHIAEDDGEVDMDFPSLDSKEVMLKFGFTVLALVEKSENNTVNCEVNITVQIPGEGTKALSIENPNVTVRDIIERTVRKKFAGSQVGLGQEYKLEKKSDPGVKLGNNTTLASLDCLAFVLVRDNGDDVSKDDWPHNGMAMMEAPLYQSYLVSILSRVRPKAGIHLGISGEKIEIDPVQRPTSAKLIWSRSQKPVTYDIDVIASCDVTDNRNTGKSTFRMVYMLPGQEYKHHDFETDSPTATEIVQKVNHILEMRSSPVRRDYIAFKGRKAHLRRSFSNRGGSSSHV